MNIHAKKRFNLVDEDWIPVAGADLVSLKKIFSDPGLRALGGNPVEKISLTKLLLAISQAACTPENDTEWARLGTAGLAAKALSYLEKNKDLFWLYGDRPFLQVPAIEKAQKRSAGNGFYPDVPAENNTILFQSQIDHGLSNPQRAIFLCTLMGFALGGKRIGEPIVLSNSYAGKTKTAKSGPSLGYLGYLHSYLVGKDILESLLLNLYTRERIKSISYFLFGIGEAPWEGMPEGENCVNANKLKNSYMGCLVPLCRFVLFAEDAIHYSEGIQYPNHIAGWREPSIAFNDQNKKVKMLWADPEKKPWRELNALLSFISSTAQREKSFECRQIQDNLLRLRMSGISRFGIWSGGLRVSSNSGDQSVKRNDDYIESEVFFKSEWFSEGIWFENLQLEMGNLEEIAKIIYGAVIGYFKQQKTDGKNQASLAANLFWQLCENKFQDLVDACGNESGKDIIAIRGLWVSFANKAYNTFCPRDTARQIEAWAASRPNLGKFIKDK